MNAQENENSISGSVPLESIVTKRLILRRSQDKRDLEEYLSHIEAADEFYIQYGTERSSRLLAMIDFHTAPVLYFTVFLKETDAMIGYVGISCISGEGAGNLEFYIFKEYRRKHFCREALSALLKHFFDGKLTDRKTVAVVAETLVGNEPAVRLLESLHFERETVGFYFNLTDKGESSARNMLVRYILKS